MTRQPGQVTSARGSARGRAQPGWETGVNGQGREDTASVEAADAPFHGPLDEDLRSQRQRLRRQLLQLLGRVRKPRAKPAQRKRRADDHRVPDLCGLQQGAADMEVNG